MTQPTDRRITIEDFDDGGLSSGRRKIHVYLPTAYAESEARYPVVYFLDGGAMISTPDSDRFDVDIAADRLVEEGKIGPTIFVGVGNSSLVGRFRDLTPTDFDGSGGGLDEFAQFLQERLKPYIDAEFRTAPGPESTGIAGASLGGLAAFLLAYRHPEMFGMAGCMSSSFAWDEKNLLTSLADDGRGCQSIRFWLDAGGGEYEVWRDTARVHGLLEQKGWTDGVDLAAYFDYPAGHNIPSQRGRIDKMLRFLLTTDAPALTGYLLIHAARPDDAVMDLREGFRRILGAEAIYADGSRLTVSDPVINVDDSGVIAVDDVDPILLHGMGSGETTIRSTYRGFEATLDVIGGDAGFAAYPCPSDRSAHEISKDGIVIARFGVTHDPSFVHVAVDVLQSTVTAEAGKDPWEQDSVEIRFDGRRESVLRKDAGYNEEDDPFIVVAMSPGPERDPISLYPSLDELPGSIPESLTPIMGERTRTGVACFLTPTGYRAILSIPTAYLDGLQDGDWQVFRVNVCVNRIDGVDHSVSDYWWVLCWLSFHSRVGSGIFRRV